MKKKRIEWLDIAKALSIILVVLGHAGHAYLDVYLGWFRIPLFFFLSGILFKPVAVQNIIKWSTNKSIKMMIPYFMYGIMLFIIFNYQDLSMFFNHILELLYGGRILQGPYGVFWFITVLLLTQILLGLLSLLKKWMQITIIFIFFILGHYPELAMYNVVWNADLVLIAIFYYSLGYYLKGFVIKYNKSIPIALISSLFAGVFIILSANGVIDYYLNLKMSRLNNILLDIIIPLSFFMPIIFISSILTEYKIKDTLEMIGKYSIVIMYLHLPINIFFRTVLDYDVTTFEFTVFGVFIPVIIGYLLSQTGVTRKLLLGQSN